MPGAEAITKGTPEQQAGKLPHQAILATLDCTFARYSSWAAAMAIKHVALAESWKIQGVWPG